MSDDMKPWTITLGGNDMMAAQAHAFSAIVLPHNGQAAAIMAFGVRDPLMEESEDPKVISFLVLDSSAIEKYISDLQIVLTQMKSM